MLNYDCAHKKLLHDFNLQLATLNRAIEINILFRKSKFIFYNY